MLVVAGCIVTVNYLKETERKLRHLAWTHLFVKKQRHKESLFNFQFLIWRYNVNHNQTCLTNDFVEVLSYDYYYICFYYQNFCICCRLTGETYDKNAFWEFTTFKNSCLLYILYLRHFHSYQNWLVIRNFCAERWKYIDITFSLTSMISIFAIDHIDSS